MKKAKSRPDGRQLCFRVTDDQYEYIKRACKIRALFEGPLNKSAEVAAFIRDTVMVSAEALHRKAADSEYNLPYLSPPTDRKAYTLEALKSEFSDTASELAQRVRSQDSK